MNGMLIQINISAGGMPKLPVARARVGRDGVQGDMQKNRKYHGGDERAICLYSEELYDFLRGSGVEARAGQVGENFTTRGIDLMALKAGDRLRVGGCVIELTKIRVPCRSLDQWDKRLMKLMEGHSGWMARVVEEGEVAAGDGISVDVG